MSGSDAPVLRLSDRRPFAVGGRRLCFVDPRDPSRCVKVNRTDDRRVGRTQPGMLLPASRRRAYDNNADERRVLGALMRRLGPERYDHMPRVHGDVETDLGRGLVLDLVRDRDGAISRSLRELICAGADPADFDETIDELGAYLLANRIPTRTLLEHNIVAQDLGGAWRLHIIDGVGDRAWIPLAQWIPPLARAKTRARLDAFRARLRQIAQLGKPREAWDTSRWGQGFLDHRGV